MAKGGFRIGAGRPKGSRDPHSLEKEKALQYLTRKVEENIEPLFTALFEKAKKGDIPAMKELFDRAFGKAPQAITGADGGALKIMFDSVFKDVTTP